MSIDAISFTQFEFELTFQLRFCRHKHSQQGALINPYSKIARKLVIFFAFRLRQQNFNGNIHPNEMTETYKIWRKKTHNTVEHVQQICNARVSVRPLRKFQPNWKPLWQRCSRRPRLSLRHGHNTHTERSDWPMHHSLGLLPCVRDEQRYTSQVIAEREDCLCGVTQRRWTTNVCGRKVE